jgi:hypothetical protein
MFAWPLSRRALSTLLMDVFPSEVMSSKSCWRAPAHFVPLGVRASIFVVCYVLPIESNDEFNAALYADCRIKFLTNGETLSTIFAHKVMGVDHLIADTCIADTCITDTCMA